MTIISAVANLVLLLAGVFAWWKEHKIRLDERDHLNLQVQALTAEKARLAVQLQQHLGEQFTEQQKVKDAEYESVKDDPKALQEWLNRQL